MIRNKTKVYFYASDGTEFNTYEEANQYEEKSIPLEKKIIFQGKDVIEVVASLQLDILTHDVLSNVDKYISLIFQDLKIPKETLEKYSLKQLKFHEDNKYEINP